MKSIVLTTDATEAGGEKQLRLLLLRGDHELNEVKASRVPGLGQFRFASEAEIVERGSAPRQAI